MVSIPFIADVSTPAANIAGMARPKSKEKLSLHPISVRVPEKLLTELERIGEKIRQEHTARVSTTALIVAAIEEYVARHKPHK